MGSIELFLPTPDDTDALARRLAQYLASGDVVLLSGDIGAGKTHFARTAIQKLLSNPEDVPSPTFTLVQVYPGPGFEIWHADLYRLTSVDEVEELGLLDAFDHACCFVEWPDRLGNETPEAALSLHFAPWEDGRRVTLHSGNPRWTGILKDLSEHA